VTEELTLQQCRSSQETYNVLPAEGETVWQDHDWDLRF